jgi:hypothetical protein
MAEVYVDSNSITSTKIIYGGEIVDADGAVMVTVFDITEDPAVTPAVDPGTSVYTTQATKTETDIGSYKINIPYSLANRSKNFKIRWNYSINGQAHQHYTTLDVVKPYCNLAEAIDDLGLGTDPSDPNYKSYHELVMAEKYARKIIDEFTGQKFATYDDVHIVYGSGSDILPLPYKLNTLHELYQNDVLIVDTINEINNWNFTTRISETGFGLRVDRQSTLDNTVYSANGMVPPSINDSYNGAFIKDYTYRVQGRFGWDVVPDQVEQACIQLMGQYFAKDRLWTDRYLKSVSTFDWDFEYADAAFTGTGSSYVDKLLSPYVLTNMVII